MIRIGVLISGNGTNLQAILEDSRRSDVAHSYEVVLVISNKKSASGLQRAKKFGIPTAVVPHADYPTREAFETELIRQLEEAKIDLVVLAGFMRVLSQKFVDYYPGKVMNIHPALLPAFPGTNAIERAWKAHTPTTGVTVHFIDEGVDTGPILLQEKVPIKKGESLEELTKKIHELEHILYPRAIRMYAEGRRGS